MPYLVRLDRSQDSTFIYIAHYEHLLRSHSILVHALRQFSAKTGFEVISLLRLLSRYLRTMTNTMKVNRCGVYDWHLERYRKRPYQSAKNNDVRGIREALNAWHPIHGGYPAQTWPMAELPRRRSLGTRTPAFSIPGLF